MPYHNPNLTTALFSRAKTLILFPERPERKNRVCKPRKMKISDVKHRNQIPQLLTELGLIGIGAEIGVAEGYNAWNILENWSGTLYLIDPYRILNTPGFSGHGEDTDEKQEARYQRVLRTSQRFGRRCNLRRLTSEDASFHFREAELDFVYIDAQHDYPSIKRDIELWHSKVRLGGLLCGHDYLSGIHNGQEYGVQQAVDELAAANGLEVFVTAEPDWPSWILRKL